MQLPLWYGSLANVLDTAAEAAVVADADGDEVGAVAAAVVTAEDVARALSEYCKSEIPVSVSGCCRPCAFSPSGTRPGAPWRRLWWIVVLFEFLGGINILPLFRRTKPWG